MPRNMGSTQPAISAPSDIRITERQAVLAIRQGDHEAFGRLVELHQNKLLSLCQMILRDIAAAEEVTQDAFLRAFIHIEKYDLDRAFYPWLASIATRLAQTWLRRRAHRVVREGIGLSPNLEQDMFTGPLGQLIADEEGRILWKTVAALSTGQRTAVYLYYRQDMPVKDIARALGVTSGTVKTLLFRARKKLRSQFDETSSSSTEKQEKLS